MFTVVWLVLSQIQNSNIVNCNFDILIKQQGSISPNAMDTFFCLLLYDWNLFIWLYYMSFE